MVAAIPSQAYWLAAWPTAKSICRELPSAAAPDRRGGWRFVTDCVSCPEEDVDALCELVDGGRRITRRTFLSHVDRDELADIEAGLGYAASTSRNGELTMAVDWHVAYYRGRWHGRRAVYFVHSAIEYIFVEVA